MQQRRSVYKINDMILYALIIYFGSWGLVLQDKLIDSFGRRARKLRISITDRCNMRCVYCMQYNNTDWIQNDNILTYEEIVKLVTIFSDLGIEKIRITGGEPTVRSNLENLVNSTFQFLLSVWLRDCFPKYKKCIFYLQSGSTRSLLVESDV